jgi:single stranded DNA-binding protein
MAKLENSVILEGVIGKDAEFKTFGSGKVLVKFSINNSKGKKRDDGTWDNIARWFDCTYWHDSDLDRQQLVKGAMVRIVGQLDVDTWEQDGQKRSKTFINVADYSMLDKDKVYAKKSDNKPASDLGKFVDDQPSNGGGNTHLGKFEDDIPFAPNVI